MTGQDIKRLQSSTNNYIIRQYVQQEVLIPQQIELVELRFKRASVDGTTTSDISERAGQHS